MGATISGHAEGIPAGCQTQRQPQGVSGKEENFPLPRVISLSRYIGVICWGQGIEQYI